MGHAACHRHCHASFVGSGRDIVMKHGTLLAPQPKGWSYLFDLGFRFHECEDHSGYLIYARITLRRSSISNPHLRMAIVIL